MNTKECVKCKLQFNQPLNRCYVYCPACSELVCHEHDIDLVDGECRYCNFDWSLFSGTCKDEDFYDKDLIDINQYAN